MGWAEEPRDYLPKSTLSGCRPGSQGWGAEVKGGPLTPCRLTWGCGLGSVPEDDADGPSQQLEDEELQGCQVPCRATVHWRRCRSG